MRCRGARPPARAIRRSCSSTWTPNRPRALQVRFAHCDVIARSGATRQSRNVCACDSGLLRSARNDGGCYFAPWRLCGSNPILRSNSSLNVQVVAPDELGVFLDEAEAGLGVAAHQALDQVGGVGRDILV